MSTERERYMSNDEVAQLIQDNKSGAWCVLCGKDSDGTVADCELHRGADLKSCHDADRKRRNARFDREAQR